jgi:hypothetical protein
MLRKLVLSMALVACGSVYAATDAPSGYTKCAQNTGATCSFSGTRQVSLGKSGEYHYNTFTNSVSCTSSNFGGAFQGVTSAWCSYAPTTGGSSTSSSSSSSSSSSTSSSTSSSSSSSSSSSTTGGRGSSCTSSAGSVSVSSTIVVSGTLDGGCRTYTPTWGDCGQAEGQDPVIRVNSGTLQNVIVGQRGDGIHIYGSATVRNINWPNVCEDALTIKASAPSVNMSNLSARDADDKMFQANAPTTTVVSNSVLTNASKFVRENGGKCYPITWTFRDSTISTAKEAIFRSDCGSSRFALINVQTSGIPEVCYSDGDYASCTVQ